MVLSQSVHLAIRIFQTMLEVQFGKEVELKDTIISSSASKSGFEFLTTISGRFYLFGEKEIHLAYAEIFTRKEGERVSACKEDRSNVRIDDVRYIVRYETLENGRNEIKIIPYSGDVYDWTVGTGYVGRTKEPLYKNL
jgi:hypothetical protein